MLSMGVIWNCATHLKKDIIQDINQKTKFLNTFEFDLGDKYEEFVRKIYMSEGMDDWKIERKIEHMKEFNSTSVVIVFFEFSEEKIEYHPYKKRNVFTQLEECKTYIREKYRNQIDNYVFDIIFHTTDDLQELKNDFRILSSFVADSKLDSNADEQLLMIKQYEEYGRINV